MKSYTITVNGTVYDVTVEEKTASASAAAPARTVAKPVQTAPVQEAVAPAASAGEGNVRIEAGAAGKVFKIETSVGAQVKKGDPLVVLEVMKMETPIVATEDGTVASILVDVGQNVEAGALLVTLNN